MRRILLSLQDTSARNVLVLISLLLRIIVSKHVLLELLGVLIQLLVMFKLQQLAYLNVLFALVRLMHLYSQELQFIILME
jgi:hypothetical protein